MTFRAPSKSLTPRDYLFITFVVIVFFVISFALVSVNLTLKGGGDFYVYWAASRGFIFEKIDPYSGEIPARVQQLVYGGAVKAGDEPYILDTPFQILLLYFPFSLFSSPQFARAIFTLIVEIGLFALGILSLRLTDWETPYFFSFLFAIFAVFNFYSFQSIYEASPVVLMGLVYAGILLALRFDQDEIAGALIAVSLYYWEVGAPFLFLILWHVYAEKRSRVFAGFFMLCFVLLTVSFLLYPNSNWIIPYFRAATNNLRADFGFNIHTAFAHIFPVQGRIFAWVFTFLLVITLGYEWNAAHSADARRFYWAASLSLAAAPLLGFRTEMEHLVVLIIPLALIFAIVHDRWRKIGDVLATLLLLIIFAVPWGIYLFTRSRFGSAAQDIIFLFLPLFTILGLYWIRWWAIRPPRIWTDLAPRQ